MSHPRDAIFFPPPVGRLTIAEERRREAGLGAEPARTALATRGARTA